MPRRVSLAIACNMIAAAVLSLGSLAATAAERVVPYLAPPGVRAEAFPRPERPVAEIVGPSISTEEARDERDEAGQVARLLRLRPGMTVGDIGAGSGYHTVRLARLLGPSGLVVAQDLSPLYLGLLARRVDRLDFRNVKSPRCGDHRACVSRDRRALCIPLQSGACAQGRRNARYCRFRQTDLAAWDGAQSLALRARGSRLPGDRFPQPRLLGR